MDEVRQVCEDSGGAHCWLHDDIGATEAYEWEGPEGALQICLDPVFGMTYLLHVEGGETITDDLNGIEHLKRLIQWLETGGEVPES